MGWDGCLDLLEAEIAALRARLDGDELPPTTSWSPPDDLGPLPDRCRDRAERLLSELHATVGEVERRRGELGQQLTQARDRRDAARTYGRAEAVTG